MKRQSGRCGDDSESVVDSRSEHIAPHLLVAKGLGTLYLDFNSPTVDFSPLPKVSSLHIFLLLHRIEITGEKRYTLYTHTEIKQILKTRMSASMCLSV